MAKSKYTKGNLMRMIKSDLLGIASNIEFVDDDNTKSEIADAILIMEPPKFDSGEGPPPGPSGPSRTPAGLSTEDDDYPRSAQAQRAWESQRKS